MEFLGLAEYNFLNRIAEWIVGFVIDIISGLFGKLLDAIKDLISSIFK